MSSGPTVAGVVEGAEANVVIVKPDGAVGAARAVEHLRLIVVELQAAPLRNGVHIGLAEFIGMLQQGKTFADYPYLEQSANVLLDDLLWWTNTLKTGREASS